MAGRKYTVYGGVSGTNITIEDTLTPFLQEILDTYGDAHFTRAARHVVYVLQKDMKAGLKKGHLSGVSIPTQSQLSGSNRTAITKSQGFSGMSAKAKRQSARAAKGGSSAGIQEHFRKKYRYQGGVGSANRNLISAIGYNKDGIQGAEVGWLSASAAKWGHLMQQGISYKVTKRMRGHFAMLGIYTKKKTINIKKVLVFDPYFTAKSSWILKRMDRRIQYNLDRSDGKKPAWSPNDGMPA